MAASVEMVEHESSSSDSYGSNSEEDTSSSEEQESDLTSWAKIYKSLKLLPAESQQKDSKSLFIFYVANGAVIHGDFLSSLRLYSLALKHFYNEHQQSLQREHTSSASSSIGSDESAKRIPFDKRLLQRALEGCAQDRGDLSCKQFRSSLAKILDSIVQYCDLLLLMDFNLLQAIASLYFRLKEKQKTFNLTSRALQMNPKSLNLQEMFENICCHLVQRWHYVMLNDQRRNYAYQQGIETVMRSIGTKAVVCDVGCGTGLLSLIACQQLNSVQVYAIEKSTSMCEVARSVFRENLDPIAAEKIVLINKMSSEMSVPHDMPCRADVLVTETFDAGLFGEGILPTLCHAWTNLLKNSGVERGQVVPGRAQLYLQALECDEILKETRFLGQFDELNTSDVHICGSTGLCQSEPYAAHDLKCLPGGYRILSDPLKFMDVDFNNPQELGCLNKGIIQESLVEITSNGRLDAVAVWFSLYLDDSVVISTHTDCHSCWDQAVFPVHSFKVMMQPLSRGPMLDLNIQTGDKLKMVHAVVGAKLSMEVTAIFRPDEASTPCNPIVQQLLNDPDIWQRHSVYCLSSKEVKVLNNTSLHFAQYKRMQELFSLVRKKHSQVEFIHLSDGFSPLCLQALKHGLHQATVLLHDKYHKSLLQKMATLNDINLSKLTFLEDVGDLIPSLLSEDADGIGPLLGCSAENSVTTQPAHAFDINDKETLSSEDEDQPSELCDANERGAVVFCDVVDFDGRLVEGLQYQEEALRYHLSKYGTSVIAPYRVDVYGMLVDSECLLRLSRVQSDDKTLGYNIGSFVNKYTTRNHQDISLITLPHTKLSQPFKMFTINISKVFEMPEPADAGTEPASTATETENTGPEPVKTGTGLGNAGPEPAKTCTGPVNISTEFTNMGAEPANTGPEPAETGTEPANTGTKSANTGPEPANTWRGPANTGTEPGSIGIEPASIGPGPASANTEPANTDIKHCSLTKKILITKQSINTTISYSHETQEQKQKVSLSSHKEMLPEEMLPEYQLVTKFNPNFSLTAKNNPTIDNDSSSNFGISTQKELCKNNLYDCGLLDKFQTEYANTKEQNIFLSQEEKAATESKFSMFSVKENADLNSENIKLNFKSASEFRVTRHHVLNESCSGVDNLDRSENNINRVSRYDLSGNDGRNESKEGSHTTKRRRLSDVDAECEVSPDCDLNLENGELNQSVDVKVSIVNPGTVTAMVYWFELHISPTCNISTIDPAHHWHQAAVMALPWQNQHVMEGDVLALFCQLSGSAISFMIE